MDSNNLFSKLALSGWRQFRDVEIDFHDRLTILTGSNGAGKSTILKILKCHFTYESDEHFLATPVREKDKTRFSLGEWFANQFGKILVSNSDSDEKIIGSITYTNDTSASLKLPTSASMEYALKRSSNVKIPGIHIDSHRPIHRYEKVSHLSISGILPKDAYEDFSKTEKAIRISQIISETAYTEK